MPNESLYEEYASFQDFRTDGYVVINNFLSRTELKVLRQECNVLVKHAFEHLAIQGAAQPGWEVVKKGCIFESLPGKPSRLLAGDRDTYVQQRSLWPCCPTACKLLLGTKVTHLVATLLGCPSANMHDCPRLFNDQVLLGTKTLTGVWKEQMVAASTFLSGALWMICPKKTGACKSEYVRQMNRFMMPSACQSRLALPSS